MQFDFANFVALFFCYQNSFLFTHSQLSYMFERRLQNERKTFTLEAVDTNIFSLDTLQAIIHFCSHCLALQPVCNLCCLWPTTGCSARIHAQNVKIYIYSRRIRCCTSELPRPCSNYHHQKCHFFALNQSCRIAPIGGYAQAVLEVNAHVETCSGVSLACGLKVKI